MTFDVVDGFGTVCAVFAAERVVRPTLGCDVVLAQRSHVGPGPDGIFVGIVPGGFEFVAATARNVTDLSVVRRLAEHAKLVGQYPQVAAFVLDHGVDELYLTFGREQYRVERVVIGVAVVDSVVERTDPDAALIVGPETPYRAFAEGPQLVRAAQTVCSETVDAAHCPDPEISFLVFAEGPDQVVF